MGDLLALGLSQRVARAALLACNKDVQRAATYALERAAAEQARKERRRKEREVAKYGKTQRGSALDVNALEQLTAGLGYDEAMAAEALRRSENVLDDAIALLSNGAAQEALQLAVMQGQQRKVAVDEEKLAALCDMGFSSLASRQALKAAHNDLSQAALALTVGAQSSAAATETAAETGGALAPMPVAAAAEGAVEEEGAAGAEAPAAAMTSSEVAAVESSGLHAAVRAAELAYEQAWMEDDAALIEHLMQAVGMQ